MSWRQRLLILISTILGALATGGTLIVTDNLGGRLDFDIGPKQISK